MAQRGSSKDRSVEHEEYIAKVYGGRRSPSSGASLTDPGDVRPRDEDTLFECKTTGEPGKPKRTTLIQIMEKVWDEAAECSREPAVAMRYFDPTSPLANRKGWVDFTVRLTTDDAVRSLALIELAKKVRECADA